MTKRVTKRQTLLAGVCAAAFAALLLPLPAAAQSDPMAEALKGWQASAAFTVGEEVGDYTPPGVLDGVGAYALDDSHVRLLVNHELGNGAGYPYEVSDGAGGSFELDSARVSYFDFDKASRELVAAGPAYSTIYDANGEIATDPSFLQDGFTGFSRFCSSVLVEPRQFGAGRGLEDRIYFTGEEDGGQFNSVGGAVWALDPETGSLWHVPAFGRGAWENVAEIDSGTRSHVAFILMDDTSPYDFDEDGTDEAAPLYLYIGEKNPDGDFLARNGLRDGKLYVWVANSGATTPLDFNGGSTPKQTKGIWMEVDNSPVPGSASEDGASGYDEFGFPTQGNLWLQAEALGAFGFSRPEDVAVDPRNGKRFVFASTGVDSYAVDAASGDGADTFGTVYTAKVVFRKLRSANPVLIAKLRVLYDGDTDEKRKLRSPDNVEWADDGRIYVQEDKAEDQSLTGEPLFGSGAANPNEAGIVQLRPWAGKPRRIVNIDREVVLDASIATPSDAVDNDAGTVGAWETSGILDVSELFDAPRASLFVFNVQAHGIDDQETANADSRLTDEDLKEGGQMLFLTAPEPPAAQ